MRNQRTWVFFSASVIISGILSFNLPLFEGNTQLLSLALSVTSILFGLLVGFFITEMWNKFTSIRRESGDLRSAVISLIENMKRLEGSESVREKFQKRMEKFLIAFILVSWDNVKEEEKYFEAVSNTITDVKPVNEKDKIVYAEILDNEQQALDSRSRLASLGQESMNKLEWTVLWILFSIITVSVFLLRDGTTFFYSLATFLPPLILLTMMLLDDLDNLRWGSSVVSFEPAQDGLRRLHEKEFYEKRFVDEGWIDVPESYRTQRDLEGELREVYEELKLKDCLREYGLLGPKL